jgi:hypothetical protein
MWFAYNHTKELHKKGRNAMKKRDRPKRLPNAFRPIYQGVWNEQRHKMEQKIVAFEAERA